MEKMWQVMCKIKVNLAALVTEGFCAYRGVLLIEFSRFIATGSLNKTVSIGG